MVTQSQRSPLSVLPSDSLQSPCLSSRSALNSPSPNLFCLCRKVGLYSFESCFNKASWTSLFRSCLWRAASTEHCKHTLDAPLPQNYSPLSFPKLLHRDSLGLQPGTVLKGHRGEREKGGKEQFGLQLGQSSNIFPGCLHALIKSATLAEALVAARGGL